jgi:hypothetical protein
MEFETVTVILTGENNVRQACTKLITASAWFEITPFPDDQWRVRVKPEAACHIIRNSLYATH